MPVADASLGHRLLSYDPDTRLGFCQKCGDVRIIKGGVVKGVQNWHCQVSHRPEATKGTRGWIHRMTSLDVPNGTGICANCGPVKLRTQGKKSDGSPKWRCENICPPVRVQPKRQNHSIIQVDEKSRTGICAICGPVDVRVKKNPQGKNYWHCEDYSRKVRAATRVRLHGPGKQKHIVSNVDAEARTGDCILCGPVKVHRGPGPKKTREYWLCANKTHENNMRRCYGITGAERQALHDAQGGCCALCGDHRDELVIDHDHSMGSGNPNAIRAMLCRECNLGLGYFRDSIDNCWGAIAYLERPLPSFPAEPHIVARRRPTREQCVHSSGASIEVNPETFMGVCRTCGPIKFSRDGFNQSGKQNWRCANSSRRTKAQRRKGQIKAHFGLSQFHYDWLLAQQENQCAICTAADTGKHTFHVDHVHPRGQRREDEDSNVPKVIRGLLCNNCNPALGAFHDDPERLLKAVEYLQRFQKEEVPVDYVPHRKSPSLTLAPLSSPAWPSPSPSFTATTASAALA